MIENGNIVEQGTHESLLEKKGVYERLYHSQFSGQSVDAVSYTHLSQKVYENMHEEV